MQTYKGWIPNVSGSISFSNIKGVRIPGRAECPLTVNFSAIGQPGIIRSLQMRSLSDQLIPWLDWTRSHRLFYLLDTSLQAKHSPGVMLGGTLVTFSPSDLRWKETRALRRCFTAEAVSAEKFKGMVDKISALGSACHIRVEVERSGIATLELDYSHPDKAPEENAKIRDSLAFEAFSFLKDLIHAHKFHRLDEDAIVVPFKVADRSDNSWVEKTQSNLHGSVISAYRNARHPADLLNALGRLTYLETFGEEIVRVLCPGVTIVNIKNLRSSLQAKVELVGAEDNKNSIFVQASIPTLLALVALVVAMSQMLQIPCIAGLSYSDPPCTKKFALQPIAFDVVAYLFTNWIHLFVATVAAMGILGLWGSRRELFWRLTNRFGVTGLRATVTRITFVGALSIKYGRAMATLWIIILAISVLGLILVCLIGIAKLASLNFF